MKHVWFQLWIGTALLVILAPFSAMAFVAPDQVAVLANRQNPESLQLATYYMRRRGIPAANRVDLNLPTTDTISREVYENDVLQPVRQAFMQHELSPRIKVLVTTFGIPLRVAGPKVTSQEKEWIHDAQGWMQAAWDLLQEQEQIAIKQQMNLSPSPQSSHDSIISFQGSAQSLTRSQIHTWRTELQQILQGVRREVERKPEGAGRKTLLASQDKIIRQVFGKFGRKGKLGAPSRLSVNDQHEEGRIHQVLMSLMYQPSEAKRTQAYAIVQEAFGMWGILAFAQWEVARYEQAEGSASLDSELSLLWWEAGTYPLEGRLPNPLYLGYGDQFKNWPLPLMMVSRIDAPTFTHARGLIEQAMATESSGLQGNVYVDAQGMKKGPPLSYGYYDSDLQNFAQRFPRGVGYPVQLENTQQRFNKPGQAPNVALYVGWYRLRHYEDAFTFNPGAIGYHIASGEAVNIHNPKELGWCKNALERGIAVTLGPVDEPYLDAFPLPSEFFGLLYSGKYSLVEAYYLSKRYVSWKMVLFGDPLYRPWFKAKPNQQKAAQTLLQNRPFPVSPTQVVFPAPDAVQDLSKFPGKYVAFDSRVLNP